jgi:hypothetical protein
MRIRGRQSPSANLLHADCVLVCLGKAYFFSSGFYQVTSALLHDSTAAVCEDLTTTMFGSLPQPLRLISRSKQTRRSRHTLTPFAAHSCWVWVPEPWLKLFTWWASWFKHQMLQVSSCRYECCC